MAKKKQREPNPPKTKEFHVTPFGGLKGMAVAETVPAEPPPIATQAAPEPADNGIDLFMQAVEVVRPLRSSTRKSVHAPPILQPKPTRRTETEPVVTEDGDFLKEIGRLKLDTKFTDSVPDEGELQPLAGNRLRQVKRGVVSVNHQIDLHGLTREESLAALPLFLQAAQKKGQKAVLVITGKGNHSQDEPVLQQAVTSWLRDGGRSIVLEFAPAPREMGGSGALVVFLRPLQPKPSAS